MFTADIKNKTNKCKRKALRHFVRGVSSIKHYMLIPVYLGLMFVTLSFANNPKLGLNCEVCLQQTVLVIALLISK